MIHFAPIDVLTFIILAAFGWKSLRVLQDLVYTVLAQDGVLDIEVGGNHLKIESREGKLPAQPLALKQAAEPEPKQEDVTMPQ